MAIPKYILVVRHGESEGNCDKSVNRYSPNHKVPLTKNGHDQARAAGLVLRRFLQLKYLEQTDVKGRNPRSILFYTSPYERAKETCNNIIEGIKGLPGVEYKVHEEPQMREQDFGNYQSTPEEMERIWEERAHYGHFFYRIPQGESAADVYDRITSFNQTLKWQFEKDSFPNILVLVSHGIWARVFLMRWFNWTYQRFETLRNIPHCKYLVVKEDKGAYKLKTPLKTWDDLPEDDIDKEVEKEFSREVAFNSQNKIEDVNDLDIRSIISAQQDAIRLIRDKDREIKEKFNKIRGVSERFKESENVDDKVDNSSADSILETEG